MGPFNNFISDTEEMMEYTQMASNWGNTLEGRAAIQSDQDRLEEWANRTIVKLNRIKYKSCTWRQRALCTDGSWGETGWGAGRQKRPLGEVSVDHHHVPWQ